MDTGPDTVDDDPIVARYSVFLKPALPAHQKLLVLQYPNRVDKTGAAPGGGGPGGGLSVGRTPTELRIKPQSGMIEVDVPLDYSSAYDRAKGMAWGSALATSTKAKAGGSHGLAGGFGVGAPQGGGRGRGGLGAGRAAGGATDEIVEEGGGGRPTASAADWAEAVRQDRVLRLQTLGGMCPPRRMAEAKWMMGVFDGGNLHLTPVNSLVHLRPQLHHIDAETEVERAKHRDAGAGAGSAGGGAGGEGGAAGGAGSAGGAGGRPGAGGARAIHMTVKSAAGTDGGGDSEVVTETMVDRLRAVQMEPWARMLYVGDDDEHSWEVYDQTLFLRGATTSSASPVESPKGKAVAKENHAADENDDDGQSLASRVSALRTTWTEADMLQAISKIPPPAEAAAGAAPVAAVTAAAAVSAAATAQASLAAAAPKKSALARGKGKEKAATATEIKSEPGEAAPPPPPPASTSPRRVRPLARPAASLAAAGASAPSTRGGRGGRTRQAGRGSAMELD